MFDQPTVKAARQQALILARTNHHKTSRLGLVIAKKHVRKSVERNRIKRIVREHFRQATLSHDSFDIVFLARKGLDNLDNRAIKALLNHLWQRLGKPTQ